MKHDGVRVLDVPALTAMAPSSVRGAFTGVVSERPRAGVVGYGVSETALSTWLKSARTGGMWILELLSRHLDTCFAGRPAACTALSMPAGDDPGRVVVACMAEADSTLLSAVPDGASVVERNAR